MRLISRHLAVGMLALLAAACEAPCPEGSLAVGDRCEPRSFDDGGAGAGGDGSSPGADAGSATCDISADCPAASPQCTTRGTCVACTSNRACDGRDRLPFCETARGTELVGQCVECLTDANCKGHAAGERCSNSTCVACKTNADCADITLPECGAGGQCTACTSDDACVGRDGAEVCRMTATATLGQCVACAEDSDCPTAEAPSCTPNGTCGKCSSDEACEGREGTEHCGGIPGTPSFGQCVPCSVETQDADCSGKSCNEREGACTSTPLSSVQLCEPCETNGDCVAGAECVEHVVVGTPQYVCLPVRPAAGCASTSNPSLAPYSVRLDATSIDGGARSAYCAPTTTCKAVIDATSATYCVTAGVYDNSRCGIAGVNDGRCLASGDGIGMCSYSCSAAADCPADKPVCSSSLCMP